MRPKILILGYGGHGKDTFALRLIEHMGLTFESSSHFACDRIVFPWFDKHLPNYYINSTHCFTGRRNWRALWHYLISQYNHGDKCKLAREIMQTNDCYVGMRAQEELDACVEANIFTHVIWVDGGDRVPIEDPSSCSVHYDPMYMERVDNSGGMFSLGKEVKRVEQLLKNYSSVV